MHRFFFRNSLFAIAVMFGTGSLAQELEERCLKNKDDICGSMDASTCFADEAKWQLVKPECEGDIQTLVEMAREAIAEMKLEGASLGGKVRNGPGMEHSQTGSLAEGNLVLLEENTGIVMNGYPWFKITHYNSASGAVLSGYQWGGILCSFDARQGVFDTCPVEWSDNPARLARSETAMEDPIAPAHGNSDEDNKLIDMATINKCLDDEAAAARDGSACIGRISEDCLAKGDDTTIAMRRCIGFELEAWDGLLNADYQKLMASLDTEAKKTSLRDAQRLWNRFVASFCPLAYEFNQGTMFLVTGDQCMMEMTARQDLELRRLNGGG